MQPKYCTTCDSKTTDNGRNSTRKNHAKAGKIVRTRYRGGEIVYQTETDKKTGKRTVVIDRRKPDERTSDMYAALNRMRAK